jgi:hypothetical protein
MSRWKCGKMGGMVLVLWALLVFAGGVLTAEAEATTAPDLAWADLHDGGAQYNDDGYRCRLAPDGHLVVAGESTEAVGGVDLLLRKLDRQNGNELWSYRLDGYDDKDIAITDMTWDSAGQLLVAGYIRGCVG